MRSRRPERARAVAINRERTHQTERRSRSIRIHRNQPTPPLERRGWRTLGVSPGKVFERAHATLGEPIALRLHPPLELRCVAQEEAVQKSALIQRHRFLQRTSLEGALEIVDVALDDFRVQRDRVGAQKDTVPQLAAERVEQLLERVAVSGSVAACSNDTTEPPPQGLPAIQSISPFDAAAGSSDLTITVAGAGFLGSGPIFTQVVWHTKDTTTDLTTTVVDSAQLTAVVPAALLRDTVLAQVHVEKRDRVEGVLLRKSNEVAFTVMPALPHRVMIDSISPTSAVAGSPDLTLILSGSGFRGKPHDNSGVEWSTKDGTTYLNTTFVSSHQITAVVPAALLSDTLVAHVYVLTGDSMGDLPLDHSNEVEFTVTPAPPD